APQRLHLHHGLAPALEHEARRCDPWVFLGVLMGVLLGMPLGVSLDVPLAGGFEAGDQLLVAAREPAGRGRGLVCPSPPGAGRTGSPSRRASSRWSSIVSRTASSSGVLTMQTSVIAGSARVAPTARSVSPTGPRRASAPSVRGAASSGSECPDAGASTTIRS